MTSLIDRIVLFLLSILMFKMNQVDYVTVCLILVVLSMEGIMMYFEEKRVVIISVSVISMLITFMEPRMIAFLPLLVYEVVKVKVYYMVPVHIFVYFVAYNGEMELSDINVLYTLIFVVIGFLMGYKTSAENEMKDNMHRMRDEQSLLQMRSMQSKKELIEKQDYEIHAATLMERNRIAREIHDHVGHMLSRSILQLGAIMAINKEENMKAPLIGLKDTLDTAMNNIRESVHDLKDESLDLEYMVRDIIKEYETLDIQLDYDMGKYLSKEIKYCFIAIVKEALTNTVKHSDGNKVTIVMREHPAIYQVLIEDNGSSQNIAVDKTGIGLENMRERVVAFKGNIRFSNDSGFKIFVSIPKGESR